MAEGAREGQAVAMTTGPAAGTGEVHYPSTAPPAVASAPSAPDLGPGAPPGQYPPQGYAENPPVQYQQQPQYPPQQQAQYVQPVQAGYAQPPPGQQYQQPVQYQQPMGGQPQPVVYAQQPTQQFAPQPVQYAGQPGFAPAVPVVQQAVVGTQTQQVQVHVAQNYYATPAAGTGQYSTHLFACENIPLCIYVCMCPACAMGDISRNVNGSYLEGCFIACCVPCLYTCATGSNVQAKYGIQGNCCLDCCLYHVCCECYLARDLQQSRVKIGGR